MNAAYLAVALFLLLNIVAGMSRIWRGPSPADRMMAAQLFGTAGVAILLLLAEGAGAPALHDVALVLALLAATATVVFVQRVWAPESNRLERRDAP